MQTDHLKNNRFLVIFASWFISIVILLQYDLVSEILTQVTFFVTIFSWYALNREFFNELKPNIEIVLFSFIVFQILDLQLINFFEPEILKNDVNYFIRLIHTILVTGEFLTLGYLLVYNNNNKQRIIPVYAFIAIISHILIYPAGEIAQIILFVFLFFILLKRTYWIELLHKNSLGIYFVFFSLLLFLLVSKAPYGSLVHQSIEANSAWFSIPKFLYDVLFVYVIALIVKIPAVLIYNHMSLSRKLWFASLFQSGIPQVFQLILICILVYFFIAGWQAQQMQNSLDEIKQSHQTVNNIQGLAVEKLNRNEGILKKISLSDINDEYYFFWRNSEKDSNLNIIRIDSIFCQKIWDNTQHILGNGIMAYPFELASWQQRIDEWDLWQKKHSIKIYPFSFVSAADEWFINYFESKNDVKDSADAVVLLDLPGKGINVGRLIIPVYNSDGTFVSHFAIDAMFNYIRVSYLDPMVGMVFALLLFFSLINFFIIRRVAQAGNAINKTIVDKFDILKKGIREISDGNLQYKLNMVGEDEFVELARRFNLMGTRLQEMINEVREKDRLDQELSIARDVQLSLLPAMLPDIPGYEIAATLETAHEVSGDLYDLLKYDDEHYLFTIGDVSGKGTSAAFYMAQFISLFRYSAQFTRFPKEIAIRINEYFTRHIQDKQIFITAIIGVLNVSDGEVTFVRAGHNNPYFLPDSGDAHELNPNGIGIGLTKSSSTFKNALEKKVLKLKKDDQLIFYTDGVVEATRTTGDSEEQFGEDNLEQIITRYKSDGPFRILKEITGGVSNFYGDHPYKDDLTVMIIRKL